MSLRNSAAGRTTSRRGYRARRRCPTASATTWRRGSADGLVDILIPAGGAHTDPLIAVEQYLAMCEGTDVAVYPGLRRPRGRLGLDGVRGAGESAAQGPVAYPRRGEPVARGGIGRHLSLQLARQPRLPQGADEPDRLAVDTLAGTDKIFAAAHRYKDAFGTVGQSWAGAFDNDRLWGQVPVPLKPTITGEGPTITIEQGDDLEANQPANIRLRLFLDEWVVGDVVKVYWDGRGAVGRAAGVPPRRGHRGQPDGRPDLRCRQCVVVPPRPRPRRGGKGKAHGQGRPGAPEPAGRLRHRADERGTGGERTRGRGSA